MKIKDLPKIRRPREKLIAYGPQQLSNTELLAIIIGSGHKKINAVELAKQILEKIDLDNLEKIQLEKLEKIFGLGQSKACQIIACLQLGKRLLTKKDNLANLTNQPEEIITFVKKLLDDAKIYTTLYFKTNTQYLLDKLNTKTKDKKVARELLSNLKKFSYLNNKHIKQILLIYFNKFITHKNYTPKQFKTDLNKLWIFVFRARIIMINPVEYEKIFSNHCLYINRYTSKNMVNMSGKFFLRLKNLVKNKEEFINNFPDQLKYGYDNELIIYILETICQHNNPEIKLSQPTLEHILPQRPSNWGLKYKQIKEVVHNIGNLTLLCEQDNNLAGNANLKEKIKKIYSKSHLQLNQELINYQNKFTKNFKQAIKFRGKKLAQKVEKIFNY